MDHIRIATTTAKPILTSAGLKVGEHPTVEEMNSRYFDRRTDALRAPTMEMTLAALVP